jgi:hypothetical protein
MFPPGNRTPAQIFQPTAQLLHRSSHCSPSPLAHVWHFTATLPVRTDASLSYSGIHRLALGDQPVAHKFSTRTWSQGAMLPHSPTHDTISYWHKLAIFSSVFLIPRDQTDRQTTLVYTPRSAAANLSLSPLLTAMTVCPCEWRNLSLCPRNVLGRNSSRVGQQMWLPRQFWVAGQQMERFLLPAHCELLAWCSVSSSRTENTTRLNSKDKPFMLCRETEHTNTSVHLTARSHRPLKRCPDVKLWRHTLRSAEPHRNQHCCPDCKCSTAP